MSHTLPLFEGLDPPAASPPVPEPAAAGRSSAGVDAQARQERHLRAAWRLSRGMWRYPDHSPEQTRAGLAICRHLQALLAQSESDRPV